MKKSISLVLVLVMMISILPKYTLAVNLSDMPKYSFAVNYSDMPDDWSKTALENAVSNGLLNGNNGKIKPKDALTRAQMAAIVNRAFGASEKASLGGITDVAANAWYQADMAKAVHMGTMMGNGFKLKPGSRITREEAFVVLARAFKLTGAPVSVIDKFADRTLVSGWAMDGVASLVQAGYIAGSYGKLNPREEITRAEFAQMMNNLLVKYFISAGVSSIGVNGNVMINTPGVTLKNMVITGDLIIGDGVGNGAATLDGVTVSGRTVIRGGGVNPIRIIGNSNLERIVIARANGIARVHSEEGSRIGSILVDGCDEVIIEGSVGTVLSVADDVIITVTDADISLITIEGYDSQIIVDARSTVEKVIISADSAAVAVSEGSRIKHIEVNGDDVIVGGAGDVGSVAANGDGAYVSTLGTSITAAAGTTGTSTGTGEVAAGSTVVIPAAIGLVPIPTGEPVPLSTQIPLTGGAGGGGGGGGGGVGSGGGGSGGDSGGGGPVTVAVGAIVITGNQTAVNGQPLQLGATVTPDNATDKTVTWSVTTLAGGTASISAAGLLTTTGVGTVTVTAKDISSQVAGIKVVTITMGEQLAPTGLAAISPNIFGGSDGKITGTTNRMEHKLASAADSTYVVCSANSTTVSVTGHYVIRFTAKTGYNAGAAAAVTVKEAIIATIAGVAAPTMAGIPVITITETSQYTGIITWSPIDADAKFTAGKEYSATITLSAKAGQDMGGVAANYFTVPGAKATNAAGSGVIIAVFPTMVASPADLVAVNTNLDGDYVQIADINLSEYPNWVPIGTIGGPFAGKYDGNGMSIDGLTISRNANNAGLFGDTLNAVFLDITLMNVDIRAYGFVGGLIGYSEGSTVTNCSVVDGNVSGSDFGIGGMIGISHDSIIKASHAGCNVAGAAKIGGLIGMLGGSSSIINSYASGNVNGRGYVGGLIGQIESADNIIISGCHATGPVTASDASSYFAGGLIGLINGNTVISSSYATGNVSGHKIVGGLVGSATKIINCYALGNVTGTDKLGGLAGQNNGSIENCFSTGKVTGTGDNCGGLIGIYYSTYVTINSYYDNTINNTLITINGLPRTTSQMKTGTADSQLDAGGLPSLLESERIYTGWNNLIWNFGTDLEYPSLK